MCAQVRARDCVRPGTPMCVHSCACVEVTNKRCCRPLLLAASEAGQWSAQDEALSRLLRKVTHNPADIANAKAAFQALAGMAKSRPISSGEREQLEFAAAKVVELAGECSVGSAWRLPWGLVLPDAPGPLWDSALATVRKRARPRMRGEGPKADEERDEGKKAFEVLACMADEGGGMPEGQQEEFEGVSQDVWKLVTMPGAGWDLPWADEEDGQPFPAASACLEAVGAAQEHT
jgi:hypothetical protein